MGDAGDKIVTIIVAIIGVATLALILSNRSNTSGVITSATRGLNSLLGTALSPVTGGGNNISGFTPQF